VQQIAVLKANTDLTGTKTFLGKNIILVSLLLNFIFLKVHAEQSSEISGLTDGGYRVTITQGENTFI
jgi:hypothetical protein